jgi:hypothetical protein
MTTRRQQVAALDDGTRTVKEICAQLGVKPGTVYDARFHRKHPEHKVVRHLAHARASEAVALLAEHEAAGVATAVAVRMTAARMGITANSVRDYRSRLTGRRNYSDAIDAGKPRPKCSGCALTLFSPEELARGTCNHCLPASAPELLGRRDEPVGVMCLPR